jgi:hypothetical protein
MKLVANNAQSIRPINHCGIPDLRHVSFAESRFAKLTWRFGILTEKVE